MNRVTEDFKKNLTNRYSQKQEIIELPAPSSQQRRIPNY
jgi:hypothetical protein